MALSKAIVTDKIEILESGIIQVREATRFMDDDQKVAETFHRRILTPGDDLGSEDPRTAAIAAAAWADYESHDAS